MNTNEMAVMGLAAEMAGSSPVSLQQALSSCSSSIGSEDDDDDILLKVFNHSKSITCNANDVSFLGGRFDRHRRHFHVRWRRKRWSQPHPHTAAFGRDGQQSRRSVFVAAHNQCWRQIQLAGKTWTLKNVIFK